MNIRFKGDVSWVRDDKNLKTDVIVVRLIDKTTDNWPIERNSIGTDFCLHYLTCTKITRQFIYLRNYICFSSKFKYNSV